MKIAKQDLIAALRLRYDHYSAQSVFETAIAKAGLPDQDVYDAHQIATFRETLRRVADRLTNVEARIDSLLEAAPAAPAPEPEKKVEKAEKAEKPEKKDDKKAEKPEKPEDKKAEKKADTKPEAKVVETTIALAGLQAGDGEQVLVCGGSAVLGDWNPEKAPAMKRDGDTWLATVKVPADIDVAFKFLRRTADGKVIWETGDDRKLVAKPRIEATWRTT